MFSKLKSFWTGGAGAGATAADDQGSESETDGMDTTRSFAIAPTPFDDHQADNIQEYQDDQQETSADPDLVQNGVGLVTLHTLNLRSRKIFRGHIPVPNSKLTSVHLERADAVTQKYAVNPTSTSPRASGGSPANQDQDGYVILNNLNLRNRTVVIRAAIPAPRKRERVERAELDTSEEQPPAVASTPVVGNHQDLQHPSFSISMLYDIDQEFLERQDVEIATQYDIMDIIRGEGTFQWPHLIGPEISEELSPTFEETLTPTFVTAETTFAFD